MKKLISWNVNGIRAAEKKGLLDYIQGSGADVVALQEIKALPEQMPESLIDPPGFRTFIHGAERKGYSGTAVYSRIEPLSMQTGLGIDAFDHEGRTQIFQFPSFTLFNVYFPNGGSGDERLGFKLRFYAAFLEVVRALDAAGRPLVICGDVNTAHRDIDLAEPERNRGVSGTLPSERAFLDQLIDMGFADTFRLFHPEPGHYTWWDNYTRARRYNKGWRIDYFFVNGILTPQVREAWIEPHVEGSDHCPIGLLLDI